MEQRPLTPICIIQPSVLGIVWSSFEYLWGRIKYLMVTFRNYSCPMLNSTHTGINPRHSKLMPTTFYICTPPSKTLRLLSTCRTFFHGLTVPQRISLKKPLAGLIDAHSGNTPGETEWLRAMKPDLVASPSRPTSVLATCIQQANNGKRHRAKSLAVY